MFFSKSVGSEMWCDMKEQVGEVEKRRKATEEEEEEEEPQKKKSKKKRKKGQD